jgi:ABC-2 type transport system permease protein
LKALYILLISDLKQFFRDKTALFFTFAFPVFFMFIFGWVFSGGEDVSYKVGVANEDSSPIGQGMVQALEQVTIFKISESDLDTGLESLRHGDISAVILIPAGIQEDIAAGQPAEIKVYYDPSQTTSSQIILSVLNDYVNEINRQLTQAPVLVTLAQESIQSQELKTIDFLVPGILGMSILFLGLFGSLTMVERREKKILKRFGATPLPRSTMIFSQVIYRLILALAQMVLIIGIAYLVFNVHMVGNWLALIGLVLLGALTFISIGYLAVSRARTTEGAMPIIQLIQFPMLFLSGIFFPIDFMPDFIRPIVEAMPLTYLGDAFRQVMVQATPLHPLWLDITVLGGWLVVCMALSIRLFRWE